MPNSGGPDPQQLEWGSPRAGGGDPGGHSLMPALQLESFLLPRSLPSQGPRAPMQFIRHTGCNRQMLQKGEDFLEVLIRVPVSERRKMPPGALETISPQFPEPGASHTLGAISGPSSSSAWGQRSHSRGDPQSVLPVA